MKMSRKRDTGQVNPAKQTLLYHVTIVGFSVDFGFRRRLESKSSYLSIGSIRLLKTYGASSNATIPRKQNTGQVKSSVQVIER